MLMMDQTKMCQNVTVEGCPCSYTLKRNSISVRYYCFSFHASHTPPLRLSDPFIMRLIIPSSCAASEPNLRNNIERCTKPLTPPPPPPPPHRLTSFRKAIAALNSFSQFQSSTPCVAYNQDAQFLHSLRCFSLRSVCGKLARNARKSPAVAYQRRVPSLQRKVQFGYRSALICSFCIILHVADVVMRIQNAHAMRKMAKCASR